MKKYKLLSFSNSIYSDSIGRTIDRDPIEEIVLDENIPIDSSSLSSDFEKKLQSMDSLRGPQAPIKSDWKVSGTFSLTPTDPRHPKGHLGVDMRAPGGTLIYPFAPGIVTYVGTDNKGGYVVKIDHENGFKTYYAHCGTIIAKEGDKVDYNTSIATVGDSGNAKGTFPHLHFQVSKNGVVQDPAIYFNVPKYTDPVKNESAWMSEDAKKEADAFDITKHTASKTTDTAKSILNANFINRLAKKYGS
jgi:murein DD-endopeptidase MepM/ murein hydrolase activator NlpD